MNELQSLSQIFQNKIFRIPDYQRGYAWQSQQLRDFWEDIHLQSDRHYHTGTSITKETESEESRKLGNDDPWSLQRDLRHTTLLMGNRGLQHL